MLESANILRGFPVSNRPACCPENDSRFRKFQFDAGLLEELLTGLAREQRRRKPFETDARAD